MCKGEKTWNIYFRFIRMLTKCSIFVYIDLIWRTHEFSVYGLNSCLICLNRFLSFAFAFLIILPIAHMQCAMCNVIMQWNALYVKKKLLFVVDDLKQYEQNHTVLVRIVLIHFKPQWFIFDYLVFSECPLECFISI